MQHYLFYTESSSTPIYCEQFFTIRNGYKLVGVRQESDNKDGYELSHSSKTSLGDIEIYFRRVSTICHTSKDSIIIQEDNLRRIEKKQSILGCPGWVQFTQEQARARGIYDLQSFVIIELGTDFKIDGDVRDLLSEPTFGMVYSLGMKTFILKLVGELYDET